jgi:hypothetical protein
MSVGRVDLVRKETDCFSRTSITFVIYTSFVHHTSVGRTNKNTVNSEASDENDTV